ncbi:SOS response-associated peptidase family protein [Pseudomonas aeruginosa]|uniref:SOS response-associated peptidase family protein n=1 Tax=Pseudomonas aeruginosa TaxID=287 RepID=UPI00209B7535|nr:SOS response-associated peptidase family protein [Pseudomonas aeruginosa]MCO7654512.1 SOS response-associated peptidase family protein [Pseudomonas aeruginosa]
MTDPEWHCEMLRRAADHLLQAGNISQSDYLDMHDLTTGALSHAQEERAAQWYKPNRTYKVALNGWEVGHIARGAFTPAVPELNDGLIRYDNHGQLVVFHQYTIYGGEIRGRHWICTNGQIYALTVIGCAWHGRQWRAFDQPDEYRLAVDLAEQAEQHGFVIITADSAGGMVDIHDRRPVVLSPELAREWLDPATTPERAEQIVLHQGEPAEAFTWYEVSRDVGNVRNQGAHLIEPQRSAS